MMNAYSFLKKFLKLQKGIVFDEVITLGYANIACWDDDPSIYWNFALVNTVLTEDNFSTIEHVFADLYRSSTILFENTPSLAELEKNLIARKYKKAYEDSWLFYEGTTIEKKYFDSVKKVENEEGLKVYLDTFDACYKKDDPQNPYGELGEYLERTKVTWLKYRNRERLSYYIVYKNNQPVAVSTLNNYQGIGYISNVGSLQSVRGDGFGKAATLFAVKESIKKGNKVTCLITEENTYPHEFYQRIGFIRRFSTSSYTKKLA